MRSEISISLLPSKKVNFIDLQSEWIQLESLSNGSFFQSWFWISSWLLPFKGQYFVLKAVVNNQVVGLAIIVKQSRKVLGFLPARQLWLNRTGLEPYDQCWIEYNDFLISTTSEHDIRAAMIAYLDGLPDWDEFIVGMASEHQDKLFKKLASNHRVLFDDIGYLVDYKLFNHEYKKDVLSRNTRQKINQTERLLNELGSLEFDIITTSEKKYNYIEDIAKLHIKRWENTETPSGFNNQNFNQFIESVLALDCTQLIIITLEGRMIGGFINFIFKNKVYFYLSALDNSFDNKVKLGMYLHTKAIEHYQQLNYDNYDFLVGDALYKKSLSTSSYRQTMTCHYRNRWVYVVEQFLRKIKTKYL